MFELFVFDCEAIKNTKKAAELKDELISAPAVGAQAWLCMELVPLTVSTSSLLIQHGKNEDVSPRG